MSEVVKTCVRYKAAVVEEDELDTGRRAVLNLGHTTAHALEVEPRLRQPPARRGGGAGLAGRLGGQRESCWDWTGR